MFKQDTLTVRTFTDAFRPLLILYGLAFFLRLDWEFFDFLSSELYQPVGVIRVLNIPWPGIAFIYVLLGIALLTSILALIGWRRKMVTFILATTLLALDAFHNMFGFINADIHMIYFLYGLAFMEAESDKPLFKSKAFLFCEIVFVLVYFQSGIAKLVESGFDWALQGGTLQIGLIRQNTYLGLLLSQSAEFAIVMSVVVLIFECLFPILYWINRRRPALYIASISFHLGTLLLMGIDFFHLWCFSLAMVIAHKAQKVKLDAYSQTPAAARSSRFRTRERHAGLKQPNIFVEFQAGYVF